MTCQDSDLLNMLAWQILILVGLLTKVQTFSLSHIIQLNVVLDSVSLCVQEWLLLSCFMTLAAEQCQSEGLVAVASEAS